MLYVQLDTNWPDHPKIIRAGIDGAGLHAVVMCLAKRTDTDGWIDRVVLERRYGAPAELIERLVELDLLEVDGEQVRPDGWLDRNPSQAAIAAKRASKSDAGRRGNHVRFHDDIPFEKCPKCQVIAGSDRNPSQPDATASPESESYTESTTAIGRATVDFRHHDVPKINPETRDLGRAVLRSLPLRKSSALPDPSAAERSAPASPLPSAASQGQGRDEHGGAA